MSTVTQGISSASNLAESSLITNFTLALANTEYSHSLQNGLKQLLVKNRETGKLQITFEVGETNTDFITIWPGSVYTLSDINFNGKILYIRTTKTPCVVEIQELF